MPKQKDDIPSHVWWSLGFDPHDPANWAMMSGLAGQIMDELKQANEK
jgi:hypothetical protein